jgi:hypothetical protein
MKSMSTPQTITTEDQNTGRMITWRIVSVSPVGPATQAATGYTHALGLKRARPTAKLYVAYATFKGDTLFTYESRPRPLGF